MKYPRVLLVMLMVLTVLVGPAMASPVVEARTFRAGVKPADLTMFDLIQGREYRVTERDWTLTFYYFSEHGGAEPVWLNTKISGYDSSISHKVEYRYYYDDEKSQWHFDSCGKTLNTTIPAHRSTFENEFWFLGPVYLRMRAGRRKFEIYLDGKLVKDVVFVYTDFDKLAKKRSQR